MKYLRSYKNHRNSNSNKINEGILGNLFKGVKSKFALQLSKTLGGSAKKVENLLTKYKQNLTTLLDEKNKKLLAIVELERAKREGSDIEDELNKAVKANEESDKIYTEKKNLLKQKFDLEFQKIIKEEDNEDIKHFIQVKKIELGEEMLSYEMNYIDQKMGISKEDIESSEMLTNIINGKKEQMKKLQGMMSQIEKEGLGKKKSDDQQPREFKVGEEIEYFMKDDTEKKEPKKAEVVEIGKKGAKEDELGEESIRVKTDTAPNGFAIKKSQVKPEQKEEDKKETPKEGEGENL